MKKMLLVLLAVMLVFAYAVYGAVRIGDSYLNQTVQVKGASGYTTFEISKMREYEDGTVKLLTKEGEVVIVQGKDIVWTPASN